MKSTLANWRLLSSLQAAAALAVAALVAGCGAAAPCSTTVVNSVQPAVATADHMAVAPGDQQKFSALSQPQATPNSSCAVPQFIAKLTPTWTVSDPTNVKISSAQDATNGLATCVGTTEAPVTVTAVGSAVAGGAPQTLATATLNCK